MEIQAVNNDLLPDLILKGDLGKLTPEQQVQYYGAMCERMGLDPLSKPFELIRLSGKLTLYCGRSGAAQLNRKHRISHDIIEKKIASGICCVTAKAIAHDGRYTTSTGAVAVEGLRGDNLANAMMKAETKAKRRATLDLVGLGMLDESELETIRHAEIVHPPAIEHKPEPVPEPKISAAQHKKLEAEISGMGLDREVVKAYMIELSKGKVQHFPDLNQAQFDYILKQLPVIAEQQKQPVFCQCGQEITDFNDIDGDMVGCCPADRCGRTWNQQGSEMT